MLKLSEGQLAKLDELEKMQYVGEVHNSIIKDHPEYAGDTTLRDRLEQAYRHAVLLGFVNGEAITQFLYYEAFAPRFYREPAINAWLTKPGQPVEQRFADLLANMKAKLRDY